VVSVNFLSICLTIYLSSHYSFPTNDKKFEVLTCLIACSCYVFTFFPLQSPVVSDAKQYRSARSASINVVISFIVTPHKLQKVDNLTTSDSSVKKVQLYSGS